MKSMDVDSCIALLPLALFARIVRYRLKEDAAWVRARKKK
jgi:hypothetical protein